MKSRGLQNRRLSGKNVEPRLFEKLVELPLELLRTILSWPMPNRTS